MTPREFQQILLRVREAILRAMAKQGFWYRREYRHDPLPWDINNGLCDEFADAVVKLVPDAEAYDLASFDRSDNAPSHVVVVWRGKFYDAECIKGVSRHRSLPIYKQRPRERVSAR